MKGFNKIARGFAVMVLVMTVGFLAQPLWAQDQAEEESSDSLDGFEDDSMDGFGDSGGFDQIQGDVEIKLDLDQIESAQAGSPNFSIYGFVKEELGYSFQYDDPEFSKIESTLNLKLEWKPFEKWEFFGNLNAFYDYSYSLRGREDFTEETLDVMESEVELRDFYFEGPLLSWLRVKSGNQIIAWGESDFGQITDFANPRDMRELGMVDLEDARIPVPSTKLSGIFGQTEVNLVAIHKARSNKMAPEGSEFDPLAEMRASGVDIQDEAMPDTSLDNTEYLFRYLQHFNGGDLSFVWADVYDDSFYMDFDRVELSGMSKKIVLTPRHKRVKVMGVAGNFVSGSFLFKGEVGKVAGRRFARNDMEDQLQALMQQKGFGPTNLPSNLVIDSSMADIKTYSDKDLLQLSAGFEYSGITDLTIAVEGLADQIQDYEDYLADSKTGGMIGAIVSYSAMNDLMNTRFFWMRLADNEGDVMRLNVDYDIIDALTVEGGVTMYLEGSDDGVIYPVRKNDRLFGSIKYSF